MELKSVKIVLAHPGYQSEIVKFSSIKDIGWGDKKLTIYGEDSKIIAEFRAESVVYYTFR